MLLYYLVADDNLYKGNILVERFDICQEEKITNVVIYIYV